MRAEFGIVGGGIVGLAIARDLARAGRTVVLFERGEPGMEASWAAAGMLAPQAEANAPGEFLSLLMRARELFPAFVSELEGETAMRVGYRADGMLVVAFDEKEVAELEARRHWQDQAGLTVERCSAEEVRRLEPGLSPDVRAALRFPGDHQIDNRPLTKALLESASAAGATICTGAAVGEIDESAGGVRLRLHDGSAHDFSRVVLAAGSWSGLVSGLPTPLPVRPVHGQLFAIEMAPPAFRHTITGAGAYMVPRADGRLIVGATSEEIGFRRMVTLEGLRRLTSAAIRLAPGIADRAIVAQWSGLRPGTPDGLPILGPDPALPRLFHATGHYRNGILLAPITGQIIGALLRDEDPGVDLAPYSLTRFTPQEAR